MGESACRITSGSGALSRASERVMTWSCWLMVTVLLASERPVCMRSTVMSSGSSAEAGRANTVWQVLTALPSWPTSAAKVAWARSWPPKTMP